MDNKLKLASRVISVRQGARDFSSEVWILLSLRASCKRSWHKKAEYHKFYMTTFDLNIKAFNHKYDYLPDMRLQFIHANLIHPDSRQLIEMPLEWINIMKGILYATHMSSDVKALLLDLPDITTILARSTAAEINLDRALNLIEHLSIFIGQSLAQDLEDVFLDLLLNQSLQYSVELAGDRKLLHVCLKYLYKADTNRFASEIARQIYLSTNCGPASAHEQVLIL